MAAMKKSGKKAAKKTAKKAPAKKAVKKAAKKAPAKKAVKKAAKKAPAKKAAKKRKPNPAFMKAMKPSADLAAIIGNKPMPRTEVTKQVWVYVKKHKLQDNQNRRMINADAKLKKVFGGKSKVSMFDMTKHISKHLS